MTPEFKTALLQLMDKAKYIEQLELQRRTLSETLARAEEDIEELRMLLGEFEPNASSQLYNKVYPIRSDQVVRLSISSRKVYFHVNQIGESL